MKLKSILLPLLFLCIKAQAQLEVESFYSPNMLVPDVLFNQSVQATNILANGMNGTNVLQTVGKFNCDNCNIQLNRGLIMSTGDVENAEGPNDITYLSSNIEESTTDADMTQLSEELGIKVLYNVTVIEFDFVAISENLDFELVWASEEYDIFSNGYFNDFCGIFLSGEGITGSYQNSAINLALIPGTDLPICLRNINNGQGNNGPCVNCELYNQYMNDEYQSAFDFDPHFMNPYFCQYDGWTEPMNIEHQLVCGQTYHLKIGIANANDDFNDSGLFIRENIHTLHDVVEVLPQFENGATTSEYLYENCGNNYITFNRPANSDLSSAFSINLTVNGSAIPDVDYNALPSQVTIPADSNQIIVPVQIIEDLIPEWDEELILTMSFEGGCSGNTFTLTKTMIISDSPPEMISESQFSITCPNTETFIEAAIEGGSGNFSYEWNTGEENDSLLIQIDTPTTFTLNITDECTGITTTQLFDVTIYNSDPLTFEINDPDSLLPIICNEYGALELDVEGGAWTHVFYIESPATTYYDENISELWISASWEGLNTITVTDLCFNTVTQSIDIVAEIDEMTISLPDTISYHCGEPLTVLLDVNYFGQYDSTLQYSWFLDDELLSDTTNTCQFDAYLVEQLNVTVNGDCVVGASEQATLVMLPYDPATVLPGYLGLCSYFNGCTDELACNYNAEAIFDDSTCVTILNPGEISGEITVGNSSEFSYHYSGNQTDYIYWELINGVIISGQGTTDITVQWDDAGTGVVMATEIVEDCFGDLVKIEVIISGIDDKRDKQIQIFPNPANHEIRIQLSQSWNNSKYSIFDQTGSLVLSGVLNNLDNILQLHQLSQGMYQMTFISEEGEQVHQKLQIIR